MILPSYVGVNPDQMDIDDDDDDDDDETTPTKPVKKRQNTYYAESSIDYPKANANVNPIVKDGIIQDWDSAVEQWQYIFDNLHADYTEQPLLLTEPVWNTEENRKKSLEVSLEQFQFPGFYLASSPTCVAFAQGRPSALVVDIGHDVVSVTPVVDGMCLARSTLKTHYAGNYLSTQLQKKLEATKTEVVPLYKVKSKVFTSPTETPNWVPKTLTRPITQSFDDYQIEKTLHGIKESLLRVPREPLTDTKLTDEEEAETHPKRSYELPNGHAIEFGRERFEIADSIFDPKNYAIPEFGPESGEPEINSKNDYVPLKRPLKKTADEEDEKSGKKTKKDIPDYRGLSELTSYALSLVDVDIRAQLAHNIIVTGGSSLITGLNERLYLELTRDHPGLKIRVHSSGSTAERKFQSWIGGSVLSSLGTFHQLWVSKKEYEEVGVDRLLAQRFR